MNKKLKTLEDLTEKTWNNELVDGVYQRIKVTPEKYFVTVDKFRQAAIEWVKQLNDDNVCIGLECESKYWFGDNVDCPCNYQHGTMGASEKKWLSEWIKHVFGVKESELE